MTKRTTISLPDDLAAKLERYGDRMNVSAIAAVAIRQEIEKLEAFDAWLMARGTNDTNGQPSNE